MPWPRNRGGQTGGSVVVRDEFKSIPVSEKKVLKP